MNENTKTISFAIAAVAALLIAWISRPSLPRAESEDPRGQELFADFTDPLAAKSLEIIKYDEDTASVEPFKVAQVEGLWAIPSHENYPADAEDQVADAAASLMNLLVLEMPSDSPGDHEMYGVVDPDPKQLSAGATGVGMRVTMTDAEGDELLAVIIGKEVPDQPELRYVRRVGQDPVYVVKLNTDALSTKFSDWIEKDLLKLNTWDIANVEIRDHSVDELQGLLVQRRQMLLDYDDTGEPRWTLVKDEKFDQNGGNWVSVSLGEDEELNTAKLDEMKNALDELKIVDVAPKPEGLSADLKADESFMNDQEAVASLASRGFYVARLGDEVELFSNEGEIRCTTKEGVEYVLRFGEIALGTAEEDPEESEEGAGGDSTEDDSEQSGRNRYILVTAEFDPEVIEKPELEPLPEADSGEGQSAEAENAEEAASEEEKAEEEGEADESGQEPADENEADGNGGDESAEAEGEKAEAEKEAGEAEAEPEEAKTDEQLQAERERIETENQRKQDEYEEKLEKGREKVKELNARFADWYYVISNDEYKKIHLSRDEIVQEKTEEEESGEGHDQAHEGMTPQALESLRQGGLGAPPE
jgi:hypothetical protein